LDGRFAGRSAGRTKICCLGDYGGVVTLGVAKA
jgi:hypothetical protein